MSEEEQAILTSRLQRIQGCVMEVEAALKAKNLEAMEISSTELERFVDDLHEAILDHLGDEEDA